MAEISATAGIAPPRVRGVIFLAKDGCRIGFVENVLQDGQRFSIADYQAAAARFQIGVELSQTFKQEGLAVFCFTCQKNGIKDKDRHNWQTAFQRCTQSGVVVQAQVAAYPPDGCLHGSELSFLFQAGQAAGDDAKDGNRLRR